MKTKSTVETTMSLTESEPSTATGAKPPGRPQIVLVSRLLLTDQLWCQGDVVVVEAGRAIQFTPRFQLRSEPMLQSGYIPPTHY